MAAPPMYFPEVQPIQVPQPGNAAAQAAQGIGGISERMGQAQALRTQAEQANADRTAQAWNTVGQAGIKGLQDRFAAGEAEKARQHEAKEHEKYQQFLLTLETHRAKLAKDRMDYRNQEQIRQLGMAKTEQRLAAANAELAKEDPIFERLLGDRGNLLKARRTFANQQQASWMNLMQSVALIGMTGGDPEKVEAVKKQMGDGFEGALKSLMQQTAEVPANDPTRWGVSPVEAVQELLRPENRGMLAKGPTALADAAVAVGKRKGLDVQPGGSLARLAQIGTYVNEFSGDPVPTTQPAGQPTSRPAELSGLSQKLPPAYVHGVARWMRDVHQLLDDQAETALSDLTGTGLADPEAVQGREHAVKLRDAVGGLLTQMDKRGYALADSLRVAALEQVKNQFMTAGASLLRGTKDWKELLSGGVLATQHWENVLATSTEQMERMADVASALRYAGATKRKAIRRKLGEAEATYNKALLSGDKNKISAASDKLDIELSTMEAELDTEMQAIQGQVPGGTPGPLTDEDVAAMKGL